MELRQIFIYALYFSAVKGAIKFDLLLAVLFCVHWAIPENIHTIPRTALRISEGEGGFTIMEF